MANWFKIFEVDLDETRMRFALNKLPETWPVWTAILMECCKHRSESFPWGQNEQELFGFSDRLKISIPKINLAISILCEINYTELDDGRLKVLKWNEKQGDYLARKSRGYWKNRSEMQKLTVNHSESHLEERRGDKNREGESEIPTLAQAVASTMTAGIPEAFSVYVYEDWSSRAGKDAGGVVVGFLPYVSKRWAREQVEWKSKTHKGTKSHANNAKPNPRNAGIALDAATQGRQTVEFLARQAREREALQNQMAAKVDRA